MATKNDFLIAITQLAAEKNLPKEVVIDAVEAALASAFKKEIQGGGANILAKVNAVTGEVQVFAIKTVVEEVTDPRAEMTLEEAHEVDAGAIIGGELSFEVTPKNAGRIAAQTAKQVVMQRLREAEREVVFTEYVGKEGDIVSGIIQRIEPKQLIIDLGKAEAVLPVTEQVKNEHYRIGQRLKVYLLEVFRSNRGPQVVVSRTHRNLVRRLFEMEVPEIYNGTVEIRAIAREPGHRSKVAVAARQEGVDPVGSCVGLRGIRIQNIINELGGEKIDVIQWDPDIAVFVSNALSPAPVLSVTISENEKTASVVVPDRQLSLAIGREGQNARLAAKLTGWRIDIKSASVAEVERLAKAEEEAASPPVPEPAPEAVIEAVSTPTAAPVPDLVPEPMPLAPAAVREEAPEVVMEPAAVPSGELEIVEREAEQELLPVGGYTLESPLEPVLADQPRIRFAEEIVDAPRGRAKKVKGKREGNESEEAAVSKVKRPKRSRPVFEIEEEDEIEDYSGVMKAPRR